MSIRKFQSALAIAVALCGASNLRADELVLDFKNGKITQLHSAGGGTAYGTSFVPTPTFGYAKATLSQRSSDQVWEGQVELNLAPGSVQGRPVPAQKRVNILVEYDGNPQGWTVHVADDNINDGYGGGGTEFQVLTFTDVNNHFENTYFGMYANAGSSVDKVIDKRVSVKDGSLRFSIANQEISIGQPYEIFQAPNAKNLIALPSSSGDMRLFAAFNRVVNYRSDRLGKGISKVIISTEAQ